MLVPTSGVTPLLGVDSQTKTNQRNQIYGVSTLELGPPHIPRNSKEQVLHASILVLEMLRTLILVDLLRVHGGPDLARCRTNSISGNQGNISSFLTANTHGLPTAFLMQLLLLLHQRRLQLAPFQLKRGYNQWAASPVGFTSERHIQLDPTFSHFSLLWETKASYPKQLQIEPLAPCPAPNGAWLYLEMEPGSIGHLLQKPPEGYEGDGLFASRTACKTHARTRFESPLMGPGKRT